MALKKWLPTHLFSKFMSDYNDNMTEIEGAMIHDSGASANGRYIRYANGTMICEIDSLTLTRNSINSLRGTWTFPSGFTNTNYALTPTILYPLNITGDMRDVGQAYVRTKYQNSCIIQIQAGGSYNWGANDEITINCIAIGRWKA